MTIITDAVSAGDIFEKYITRAPINITVISEDGDTFPPEAVKMLLSVQANIVTVPSGASKMFAFGLAAGAGSRPKDTYIITADPEISRAAELMGFQTQLPKKTGAAKGKTRTVNTKAETTQKKTGSNTEKPKQTRSKTAAKDDKVGAEKAENGAKLAPRQAAKELLVTNKTSDPKVLKTTGTRSSKMKSEDTEPVRKPAPKPETVYKDNSEAAGTKPASAFVKAIVKAGVNKEDAQGVWNAIVKSSASIVYDMQLRLCLLDADKAKDIYGKTRDMFDDLKALTGGLDG